ncbi:MAG TPA: lanthionine synthetase LanC family protein [Ktedonobacteraceae bacterium]|nr:lanthionine synthetase LanC family protein [Ktedonobacteraceae bacterium]
MEVFWSNVQMELEGNDPLIRAIQEASSNASKDALNKRWHVKRSTDPSQQWISFHCDAGTRPQQGWKLHVSAHISSAETVLHRVLPILLAEATDFKVAASVSRLDFLNQGLGGSSQVGKFITIYPENDDVAVRLAAKLDLTTRGLHGPNIPSDHPLRPGSSIYYRYGSFAGKHLLQDLNGSVIPAIYTPNNELVSDQRLTHYAPPNWAVDPFTRAGIAEALPEPLRIIANRYLLITALAASPNHIVYLGTDLDAGRTCILKGPGYSGQNGSADRSFSQRLQNEASTLTSLAPDPRIPAFYDLVEQGSDVFLVLEDVEGETLKEYAIRLSRHSRTLSSQQVLAWGQELADLLEKMHGQGTIYADMKPTNVIITPVGQLKLIDFGSAKCTGQPGEGTPGYMSPQHARGEGLHVSDDMYSLGALLYSLATGVEPQPDMGQHPLFERNFSLLCPTIHPALKTIILRCLAKEADQRYSSMADVRAALVAAEYQRAPLSIASQDEAGDNADREDTRKSRYRLLAGRLLTTLCARAEEAQDQDGLFWKSSHPLIYGLATRDLNAGNAGTVLALAELVSELGDLQSRITLVRGAQWLKRAPVIGPQELSGLYVGTAGVGAALLRAGQVLQDDTLLNAASECGRRILSLPYNSPDVFNGVAGRLRFHLLLWDACCEEEQLQAAITCGKYLQQMASTNEKQEVSWTIPAGYGSLSRQTYAGYAHGAAGIADALLDLFDVTGDERLLPFILGAGRWLTRLAFPALNDQSGAGWPDVEGGNASAAYWCHGATGIGRFFLHLSRHALLPGARDLALRAARTAAHGTRWFNPTRCHGLAGCIEFLLDVYQETRDPAYFAKADSLGQLLETSETIQQGHSVFPSEQPGVFTPDYMVGYAGVALSLLRLSAPERLPHQLSRPGFRVSSNANLQHV